MGPVGMSRHPFDLSLHPSSSSRCCPESSLASIHPATRRLCPFSPDTGQDVLDGPWREDVLDDHGGSTGDAGSIPEG